VVQRWRRPRRWRRATLNKWREARERILLVEGFTEDEAFVLKEVRISLRPIRNLRKRRKRRIVHFLRMGYEFGDAVEMVRAEVRDTDEELIDWDRLYRVLY